MAAAALVAVQWAVLCQTQVVAVSGVQVAVGLPVLCHCIVVAGAEVAVVDEHSMSAVELLHTVGGCQVCCCVFAMSCAVLFLSLEVYEVQSDQGRSTCFSWAFVSADVHVASQDSATQQRKQVLDTIWVIA